MSRSQNQSTLSPSRSPNTSCVPGGTPIRLAILGPNETHARYLQRFFTSAKDTESITLERNRACLLEDLSKGKVNSVILDLKHLDPDQVVEVLGTIREDYPTVPICLSGPRSQLSDLPGVPEDLRTQLQYYIKFASDQSSESAILDAASVLQRLRLYIQRKTALMQVCEFLEAIKGNPPGHQLDEGEVSRV